LRKSLQERQSFAAQSSEIVAGWGFGEVDCEEETAHGNTVMRAMEPNRFIAHLTIYTIARKK
jgi:hypothetical protein